MSLEIIKQQEVLGKQFKIYGDFENPLFLAKDVALFIENSNTSQMLQTIDEDEKALYTMYRVDGSTHKQWFLTEDGLYEVLMQSRKPIAKEFKKQVKVILKSIRKNGMYAKDELLDNPDLLLEVVTKLKNEREMRIQAENEKAILIHTNKVYTATEIAKELGFKSAIALNNDLCDKGIQFKQNGTWVMYSKYANLGYTEIKQTVLDNGKIVYDRKFTGLGRNWLLNIYGV